jgi:hypothetical protein
MDASPLSTGRVATPPVTTATDATASSAVGVPSPASSSTNFTADDCATSAKRPRLRSTKSELFLVQSDFVRDAGDTDSSCDAAPPHCGPTSAMVRVSPVITNVSDDSADDVAMMTDTLSKSAAATTTAPEIELINTSCSTSGLVVKNASLPSTDVAESTALDVSVS